MNLSKFLTYWSLLFAVLTIWGFSTLVALGDVKDELLDAFKRRWAASAKSKLALVDPLAGRTPAETLTSRPLTESQTWLLGQVVPITDRLGLGVRTLVLQDTFEHYVVYVTQGKRLVTYRLDRAWVEEARAGNADQLVRIRNGVERYLRREFLGEEPAPVVAPVVAAPAGAPQSPAAAGAAAGAPAPGGTDVSREERIAAAKAKAEALKAARAASGESGPAPSPPSVPPRDEAR